jgi:hypothetical protein
MNPSDIERLLDAIYDKGYDDAHAGLPPVDDCGDFEDEYMAGYYDGLQENEPCLR